jgi:hypothetical protein
MLRTLAAAGLLAAGVAAAGEFEFTDFASTKNLYTIRDAGRSKRVLRLTPAVKFRAGAAWHRVKQPVAEGFETTFTFRFTEQDDGNDKGADGLAFVVQNESRSAIGGFGASGGFMRSDNGAPGGFERGITRRVAIFFDTFENKWDANGNYLAVCTNGATAEIRWPPRCSAYSQQLPMNLKDGRPHTARITYDPPQLAVYLDGGEEPIRTASVDVASILGGDGTAWVGFTASTGGGFENHDVLSWKFSPGPRRGAAESNMAMTDSAITYAPFPCLPDRKVCTPEQAVIQEKGPGEYHVYLPAHLEWGGRVANPNSTPVRVYNVKGVVCWDPRLRNSTGCNGPAGNGVIPGPDPEGGPGFVAPQKAAGALVVRNLNGSTYFTVNDRTGADFKDNEGYFEFDVTVMVRR